MQALHPKHIRSVIQQIPQWCIAGVISEETGQQLIHHATQQLQSQSAPHQAIKRIANISITLGTCFIISGISYFFASNWGGIPRLAKIAIAVIAMLLPYLLYFKIPTRYSRFQPLLLSAGVLMFGIGLALIGQVYNSHASSTSLFVITAIPAILFTILTRYESTAVISVILINIAIWSFFHPILDAQIELTCGILATLNLLATVLFHITQDTLKVGRIAKTVASLFGALSLYALTFFFVVGSHIWWTNPLFIIVTVGIIVGQLKTTIDSRLVLSQATVLMIYILSKYIEILIYHGNLFFLPIGGILLLYVNVIFFKRLNKKIKGTPHGNQS